MTIRVYWSFEFESNQRLLDDVLIGLVDQTFVVVAGRAASCKLFHPIQIELISEDASSWKNGTNEWSRSIRMVTKLSSGHLVT